MVNPLISILIPAYNVEKYIVECLDSVVNQSYRNLQIVIVDDGSTDGTGEICDKYAESDSRIEVYHIQNGGVANARNILLSKIKGAYFLFVDSDDKINHKTIEFLVEKTRGGLMDMVTYEMYKPPYTPQFEEISEKEYTRQEIIKEFIKHTRINGSLCIKLIKTSVIKFSRFRGDISYGEDALFCWELLQNINRISVTDAPLYFYRMSPISLSHRKWTPEGKGSGDKVWKEITKDVEKKYPQFRGIVYSRTALNTMWSLLFASRSNYPKDDHIKERQRFINSHVFDLIKLPLAGFKQLMATIVVGRWYGGAKIINKLLG